MSTNGRSAILEAGSPHALLALGLSVAHYPGPSHRAQDVRENLWHLQRENKLQWHVRTFETAAHYGRVLSEWTPDIAIAHWHGEARTGAAFDLPTQVAQRLRLQRERADAGPFLAGQFSQLDIRFDPNDRDSLIADLLTAYDMLFCQSDIERVFRNVAIGLWNSVHTSGGGSGSHFAFEADFEAYPRSALR